MDAEVRVDESLVVFPALHQGGLLPASGAVRPTTRYRDVWSGHLGLALAFLFAAPAQVASRQEFHVLGLGGKRPPSLQTFPILPALMDIEDDFSYPAVLHREQVRLEENIKVWCPKMTAEATPTEGS